MFHSPHIDRTVKDPCYVLHAKLTKWAMANDWAQIKEYIIVMLLSFNIII